MAITKERAEKDGMLGGGCPELKGKEKLDWDMLEDSNITIASVVNTTNADGEKLTAITVEEYPDRFLWAGTVISKWAENYGDEFIGTVISVGKMTKTKQGRQCRAFDIV